MNAVEMRSITQRFGNVTALEDVDLVVESGTIHAIVGENGAGKTTLMRILYGALQPSHGELRVREQATRFHNSKEAIAAGIGMVSQHYGIIPELSCLQNLILGAEGGPIINRGQAATRAQELAQRMGFRFNWSQDAAELSPAGAQKLEILKLLWRNAQIMILDEPTAMLSPQDGKALFQSMQKLVAEGATVLLVTHRLPEVMDYCQRVTVLRAGKKVAERLVSETNPRELAELIVGGNLVEHEPRPSRAPGDPMLEVRGLVVKGSRGDDALKGVGLTAREGEIVGIAGVDGSGQRELFQAIAGTTSVKGGTVIFRSQDVSHRPTAERIRHGLRVIPEDRHAEAVVEEWSLEENSSLGLQRLDPLAKGPFVNPERRREWAQAVADRFNTRHGGLHLPMASLSGGNQQRFVAARALEMGPQLVLAFQPARGLDLGGTADVYRAIREKCETGAAAVVVSFDLDELLEHADRIVVMHDGMIHIPPPGLEKDRNAIGRLMTGAVA
jgi:simple sugar transport system ATP-binding protein